MAKRRDTANDAVEFFRTAQPDAARVVFNIVKGELERRGVLGAKKKSARGTKAPSSQDAPKND